MTTLKNNTFLKRALRGRFQEKNGRSDSEASSSSQSASTVDAADSDSDLEDLTDNYTSLQFIAAAMRETIASTQQSDTKSPLVQEWDFPEGRELDFCPPAWPLGQAGTRTEATAQWVGQNIGPAL